jgi:SNF5 / SMARCB1 / INI1
MDEASDGVLTDNLIPIRLELNVGGSLVTEYFTWNQDEATVTPAEFAAQLVADLNMSPQATAGIATAIADQIAAGVGPAPVDPDEPPVDDGGDAGTGDRDRPGEARQIVKFSVRVGRVVLKDQFEWDVAHAENKPEAFAETLSADLGLGREFVPAIAHGVREQLLGVTASQRRRAVCPPLNGRTAVRAPSSVLAFEPVVECLSMSQQDNLERKEKREARLARRNREPTPKTGRATGKRRLSATDLV